jgi:glutamyl-tRNA synthetase
MLTSKRRGPILKSRTLPEYVSSLLREGVKKSYMNAREFVTLHQSFFTQTINRPPYTAATKPKSEASETTFTNPVPLSHLRTAAAVLCLVPESHWTAETHRANISSHISSDIALTNLAESSTTSAADLPFRKELYHYLRWALLGGAPGLGIPATMEILGREESIRRLQEAREITESSLESVDASGKGSENRREDGADPDAWRRSLARK